MRVDSGGARRLAVFADTTDHAVSDVRVDGQELSGGPPWPTAAPWTWGFRADAVAGQPLDVRLTVRGDGAVPLRVVSYADGLPRLPELTPLPEDLTWSPLPANLTVAARTYHV